MERVIVFDTTLRDGEQTPGVALTKDEKLEIARALERLRVDVIEAGFPISSKGEFEAVSAIAKEIKGSTICGLARALSQDVDICWEAIKKAKIPRIHVFISSSDIHRMHQLEKSREEVLEMARNAVARAARYTSDVEFSPMDATRSDPEYVYLLLRECINAGATTVNIPDTVGYAIPHEFEAFIKSIMENVTNINKAVLSVHCHDDLGLAVANSLAGIRGGARQFECTINGIGERAGNASLEEIVMALKTRKDFFNLTTRIDTTQLTRVSRLVSSITGIPVQPNKAIVGANAFRHQSGIHQHGVLKMRETFEIIDPREVGLTTGTQIILSKTSGRHGLRARLKELGYELSEEELNQVFIAFKELADKKGHIDDRDLESIMSYKLKAFPETYKLDLVQISCGNRSIPTATVRLIGPGDKTVFDTATGNGPVDAVYKAIDKIVRVPNRLVEFSVSSISETTEAIGETTVRIESEGKIFIGRGSDTDIIVASAKAYLNALNRLLYFKQPKEAPAP